MPAARPKINDAHSHNIVGICMSATLVNFAHKPDP